MQTRALLSLCLAATIWIALLPTGCDDARSRRSADEPLDNAATPPIDAGDASPDISARPDTTDSDADTSSSPDVTPDLPGDPDRCSSAVGCTTELCAYGEGDECRDVCILDARGEGIREFYCSLRCTSTLECGEGEVCLETELTPGAIGPSYCVRYLPECGNRVLDDGEACDDGDTESGDGCNAACTSDETCGNAFLDPDEACDDGDTESGDGCNAACTSDETCGNLFIDPEEDCDDGNDINGDGCDACTFSECGNLLVSDSEACDDGNDDDSDGCNSDCQVVPEQVEDLEGEPVARATLGAIEEDTFVHDLLVHAEGDDILVSWITRGGQWRGLHSANDGASWARSVTLAEGFAVSAASQRYNGFVPGDDGLVAWSYNRLEDTLTIRRSLDRGATWEQGVTTQQWPRPSAGQVNDGFTSWTHGGAWFMAWTENTARAVQVRRSMDHGASFEPPAQIGEDAGCTRPPIVHYDDEGNALLGSCGALFRSVDFSASFEPIVDPPVGLGSASMVSLGDGAFVAVLGERVWRTEDVGTTWEETTFPFSDGRPALLGFPDGEVVWFSGDGAQNQSDPVTIDTAFSPDGGSSYTPTTQLATIPRLTGVFGDVTSEGAFIFWAGERRFQVSHSARGARFSAPYAISPGRSDGLAHLKIFGTTSSTHAVWLEEEDGVDVVRHRRVPLPDPIEPPEPVEDLDAPAECLFSPDPGAVAPVPTITSSSVTGMAPLTVHFHGLDTPQTDQARAESLYAWDFGDAAGEHNQLEGWNVAHVFDAPGSYIVTLTLTTRDGATSSATTTVDVQPDTRARIYVSADGDDSSDGFTPETAIQTLGELRGRLQADTTALFRRGDVFETDPGQQDRWFTLDVDNVVLTAFGEAADPPELRATNRQSVLFFDAVSRVLVEDLRFTSTSALNINARAIDSHASFVTVRRCAIATIAEGMSFTGGDHLFTADNNVSVRWGYGTLAWHGTAPVDDQVHVGNSYSGGVNSPGMLLGGSRILVADNRISSREDNPFGARATTGEHVYVVHNDISRGLELTGVQRFVIARNLLNQRREPHTALHLDDASGAGQVRNNVLLATVADALVIAGDDTAVVNNTIFATAVSPGRLLVVSPTAAGHRLLNNLFVSTSLATSFEQVVSLEDPDALEAGCFNLFPIPFDGAWAASPSTGWNSHTDLILPDVTWRPPPGSGPVGFARPVAGVRTDRNGTLRPDGGAWTAGAIEALP